MSLSDSVASFRIETLLKHNTPKNPMTVVRLHAYPEDPRICVLTYLNEYLERTMALRSSSRLFVSSISPHNGVSKDTLSRWIKLILSKAGIDTAIFKAHSSRSAAGSAAARSIDIRHVLKTAGWTNESTFSKFYNRSLTSDDSSAVFADSVLRS